MIDEYSITLSEMDRIAGQIGMSAMERAVHPLMLMTAEIDAHVAVQNRIIELGNGKGLAYCDSPTSVAVAFGVVKRNVFLLREAAAEPCVRHTLLDDSAEHSRALDGEAELFIRQRRESTGMRLRELRQTLVGRRPQQGHSACSSTRCRCEVQAILTLDSRAAPTVCSS